MALHEIRFPSANGRDQIHGWIYAPATTPRAIVQIAHGLGEHSRRYLHLISALLDAGFVVAADDHAGHGATAVESGVWDDTGENGAAVVVDDENAKAFFFHGANPSASLAGRLAGPWRAGKQR